MVSATKVTAVVPAQAAMLHNIFVTTPGGTSATVAGDAFTDHWPKPRPPAAAPGQLMGEDRL